MCCGKSSAACSSCTASQQLWGVSHYDTYCDSWAWGPRPVAKASCHPGTCRWSPVRLWKKGHSSSPLMYHYRELLVRGFAGFTGSWLTGSRRKRAQASDQKYPWRLIALPSLMFSPFCSSAYTVGAMSGTACSKSIAASTVIHHIENCA